MNLNWSNLGNMAGLHYGAGKVEETELIAK